MIIRRIYNRVKFEVHLLFMLIGFCPKCFLFTVNRVRTGSMVCSKCGYRM